jgi:hypothetical protein
MKKIRHGVVLGARGAGAEAEIGTWHKNSGCIAVRPSDGATSHYLIHSEAEFKEEFARKPGARQLKKILENPTLVFYRVVVGK